MEQCIGCGHNEFNTDTGEYLECRRCGLITAQAELIDLKILLAAEQRQYPDRAPHSADAAEVYADEEETLDSAWRLMQAHAWDKALDDLFPAAIPSQHPLEFAVWRGLCRIAPAGTDPLPFRRILDCQAAVLRAVRFRTLHTASTGHACGRESGSALIGRQQGK